MDGEKFNHPQFGEIEIGGPKKNYIRNHPGFMFEEDAHRNMAFTIFHAHQMPVLEVSNVVVKDMGNNIKSVTATIVNKRIIPTHSSFDEKHKITPPDFISLEGVKVIAGMTVQNEDLNLFTEQKHNPGEIEISNISGMQAVKVRWLVSGQVNNTTIKVNSTKGGMVTYAIK